MLWNELHKQIRDYSDKIVNEDIEMLFEHRKNLSEENWEIFFDRYCRSFVNKNKILFELLIGSCVPGNQLDTRRIRELSINSSHKVLHNIVEKFNVGA